MNTYEENLKSTAIATLGALAAEQDRLDSTQTAEHYNLYYAQGAQLTALDKVGATKHTLKSAGAINTECLSNDNAAVNLLATATMANGTVTTSGTNMATAASNVQIASNAIAMVAAEIGAALNNATASLYKTDVYSKLLNANALINEVANESRRVSDMAMMASSNTSEIIAGPVLTQATAFKGKVDGLLKATQAEFDKFNDLYVSEKAAVGQASIAERQAEGAVKDADCEAAAIDTAYQNANAQLNVGLSVSVASAEVAATQPSCTVTVNYNVLSTPQFYSVPGDLKIPAMAPQYFVALVPEAKKTTLTTDLAEQLFNARQESNTQFQAMGLTGTQLTFTTDVYLNNIVPGQPYVAFLYAVLSNEYKFFINNYSDWLSAPSARFMVAEVLPTAQNITAKLPQPAEPDRPLFVNFYAAPFNPAGGQLEYRCILVEEDQNDFALGLLSKEPSPIYFDLDIALQVAPANYEKFMVAPAAPAEEPSDASQPEVAAAAPSSRPRPIRPNVTINFNSCSTDNYGNMLRPGATYRPYVLATVTGASASAYVSTLAFGDTIQLPGA
ncbi:hypothetical protein NX774_21340 [Massilia agilis]|uniref:Uncharacterized protein n=1 Tax=Massilia agilis TaxID=1811226 RepID=A0ABT2DGT6_9BURK|nr:hypothetical protein [Massilia agilis]MCS0810472.1 hypothetical protein [Massilia agilis]